MTKVYEDFKGAPFKIGEKVVISWIPGSENVSDILSYIGCTGTVSHFNYVESIADTYPYDPMTGVLFEDGRVEYFETERLRRKP